MSLIKNTNITEEKTQKIAVIIDADNASAKDIKNILEELTKYGETIVRRIYGNFVNLNSGWKQAINDLAIKPMQQFSYTTGKNATDGFMIIDAMDLLYTDRFDGFCIVSSDSDFTALAIRIKEQGATVYGFGKKQTPEAFRNACTVFTYVENLADEDDPYQTDENSPQTENEDSPGKVIALQDLPLDKFKKIFDSNDNDWISLSLFGSKIKLLITDFDSRSYGFEKLSELVVNRPDLFEHKHVEVNERLWMMVKLKKLTLPIIEDETKTLIKRTSDDWVFITTIASKLKKSLPIDPREHNQSNYVELIKSFNTSLEFKYNQVKNHKHLMVRLKDRKTNPINQQQ